MAGQGAQDETGERTLNQLVEVDDTGGRFQTGSDGASAQGSMEWPVVDADPQGGPLRRKPGSPLDGAVSVPEARIPVPPNEAPGGASGSSLNGEPLGIGAMRMIAAGERPAGGLRTGGSLDGAVFVPSLAAVQLERAYDDKHAKASEPEPDEPEKPDEYRFIAQLAPDQGCPSCGGPLFEVARRDERRLERVHHRFEIQHIRRGLFDCPACGLDTLIPAASPARITDALPVGNGLLASIILVRYHDQQALLNQEVVYGLLGVNMRHKRVGEELRRVAVLARPVWQAMLPRGGAVRAEGPITTRTPATPAALMGAMWTLSDGDHVVFQHLTDDSDPVVQAGLQRSGDGAVMVRVLDTRAGRGRLGRLAELRRRFLLAAPVRLTDAMRALHRLSMLDRQLGLGQVDGLEAVGDWLREEGERFASPTDLYQAAVHHGLEQWSFILDEPEVEQGQAPVVWAFEPWEGGVHSAKVWLSFIQSCWEHGDDIWLYLRDLLDALSQDPGLDPEAWTPAAWRRR